MLSANKAQAGISTYTLYKEEPSTNDPEFFHIEDIKSRARLYNWRISTHAHPQLFQLIFINSGKVKARIDGKEYIKTGPCAFLIPALVVHGFEFEQNTLGYVISISRLLLTDEQLSRSGVPTTKLVQTPQVISIDTKQTNKEFINSIFAMLTNEYTSNLAGKQQLFENLFFALLVILSRNLQEADTPATPDYYASRYQQIHDLIEKYYRQHKNCDFYADKLCTTSVSINRSCKAVTGKSFGDLIQDRLALEAQRMLIYSSAPVSLIAYELGFADPAYFSRFFKRRVGSSPSTFRESREKI